MTKDERSDASQVTSIQAMFYYCSSLESVNMNAFASAHLSGYNFGVFSSCSALREIDLSALNFSDVANMANIFGDCGNLESVRFGDVTFADGASVIYMFMDCRNLRTLDLSGFDTAGLKNMERMFDGCTSLETLDLSSFDTHSATNMQNMFRGCTSLTQVTLGERFTFKGSGGTPLASLPIGKWLSEADQQIYYANQIAEDRADIADTYTFEGNDGSAAGHWGTCEWELDTDGTLTVHAGTGVAAANDTSPWADYAGQIQAIYFEDGVVMPESCDRLLSELSALKTVDFPTLGLPARAMTQESRMILLLQTDALGVPAPQRHHRGTHLIGPHAFPRRGKKAAHRRARGKAQVHQPPAHAAGRGQKGHPAPLPLPQTGQILHWETPPAFQDMPGKLRGDKNNG